MRPDAPRDEPEPSLPSRERGLKFWFLLVGFVIVRSRSLHGSVD